MLVELTSNHTADGAQLMSTAIDLNAPADSELVPHLVPSPRPRQRRYGLTLRVTDVPVVNVALALAQWLRRPRAQGNGSEVFRRSDTIASVAVAITWAIFLITY